MLKIVTLLEENYVEPRIICILMPLTTSLPYSPQMLDSCWMQAPCSAMIQDGENT